MNRNLKKRTLYVRNLSVETTEDDLRSLFAQFGVVTGVTMRRDRITGSSWGYAHVEMETALATKIALRGADDRILHNRQIRVLRVRH